ncbi:hypothetical protein [Vibrio gallaecicus]|nr:hypothetical protein [Vibrio gallaecicus]MDN3613797.1 hypothetical protein [Vibrio gallaecicus]
MTFLVCFLASLSGHKLPPDCHNFVLPVHMQRLYLSYRTMAL